MKLKILYIKDNGKHDNERLVLKAAEDLNTNNYLLLDSTYNNGQLSNKDRHPFWFPSENIKKGDLVVLYTCKGKNTIQTNSSNKTYFFYWGLDSSVWNNDGDVATLIEIADYESKTVKDGASK